MRAVLALAVFSLLALPAAAEPPKSTSELAALQSALKTLRVELGDDASPAARAALAGLEARAAVLAALLTPRAPVERAPRAASNAELTALENSLRAAPLAADKLRVLRSAAPRHRFTTGQVRRLVGALDFGPDRVAALATLHGRLVDPERFHTLYDLLAHATDREALEQRLNR